MPSGKQIAFQPSFTLVLAEHRVQHPSIRRQEFIVIILPTFPLSIGNFKDGAQKIRKRLIGTENPEITLILI